MLRSAAGKAHETGCFYKGLLCVLAELFCNSRDAVIVCRRQWSCLLCCAAGMALGTGSALAHRAVDSVLGSRHPEPAQAQACDVWMLR